MGNSNEFKKHGRKGLTDLDRQMAARGGYDPDKEYVSPALAKQKAEEQKKKDRRQAKQLGITLDELVQRRAMDAGNPTRSEDATIVFKRTQDFLFDDEAEAPRASKTFSFKQWLALYRPNMKYPEGNHVIEGAEWGDRKTYCDENNLCFITLQPLGRDAEDVVVKDRRIGIVPLKQVGTSLIQMVLA
jgi:hypothetical protein